MNLDRKRNALPALLLVIIAALACEGTPAAMQILDQPVYVCPTATPRPTAPPVPTSVQPPIVVPPSGWATNTPIPGCVWNGFICATSIPYLGGQYTTPGYSRPGATSTPRPTTPPYPTPTPFVMRPPDNFFMGDPIYTGGFVSSATARLRLVNAQTISASPAQGHPRSIVIWEVEIKNEGTTPYDVFPAWQMYVSTVRTSDWRRGWIVGYQPRRIERSWTRYQRRSGHARPGTNAAIYVGSLHPRWNTKALYLGT